MLLEPFASDPSARGWRLHGESSHFRWKSDTGELAVTWDSRRPNAAFYMPLPTVLTRADTFSFRCSLVLDAIATETPETTFQIALGFVRQADARGPSFFRGAGIHPAWGPRNLVEFDYFPASQSIAPTVSAVAVATNNTRWATLDLFPYTLEPGTRYGIHVRHDSVASRLRLEVTEAGRVLAEGSVALTAAFGDFRLDAFSITSYSGDHQPAGYGGHVRAEGRLDDIELEFPDPPRVGLVARRSGDAVAVHSAKVPGWTPVLERNSDGSAWESVDATRASEADAWVLTDPSPPRASALYRIRWERP
ncbi:MAG: hypothetical protein JNL97_02775 [Verrucomicrobiales bacterium]|nr:hypothetical protein [Verrucomicrobiales bacterium]